MITQSGNVNIADWGFELDQRMCSVVWIGGASLAIGTEIGIVADSALVSVALNICLSTIALAAERTITIDAVVASLVAVGSRQCNHVVERLVDGDKPVAWMDKAGVDNAA